MIRRTSALAAPHADKIRVAVLGGGMSGCSFASTLLESTGNFDITIFEGGRGVGGRTSTRQVQLDNGTQLRFDHGCPSIDPPRTHAFRRELGRWRELGWVQPWEGTFAAVGPDSSYRAAAGARFVGHPTMGAVCKKLVATTSEHSTLAIATGSQARAKRDAGTWQLHKDSREGKVDQGEFDWLVSTDRNSLKNGRQDFKDADLDAYRKKVNEGIGSVPMITAIVAFDGRLPVNADVIDFDGEVHERFGVLGKLIRESSKPGRRDEDDAIDRWVLHGNQREGKRLLQRPELKNAKLDKIRPAIRDRMVEDFVKAIPLLVEMESSNDTKACSEVKIPEIVYSAGHRWGAAFPICNDGSAFLGNRRECEFDAEGQFVACGDYFGLASDVGSVETAYLSGRAAANCLIEHVKR